jgi:hypothetical protein
VVVKTVEVKKDENKLELEGEKMKFSGSGSVS